MPRAQTDRNRQIAERRQATGLSYRALGAQVGITMQRAHEIVTREQARALRTRAILEEATRPLAARRVARLPLPAAVRQALEAAGIQTVGDLLTYDRDELLGLDGFGRAALAEVSQYLANPGRRRGAGVATS